MGLEELLLGQKILETATSDINGTLTVVKDRAWGTYIKTGSLTQSGGVARTVWETTLGQLEDRTVSSVLILGLAAGGMLDPLEKHWPGARVVGVEVDPVMIELGKKYMALDKKSVDIHITDATEFLKKNKEVYDLILVDMYVGSEVPQAFTKAQFVKAVKKALSPQGTAVFNRLYDGRSRKAAYEFLKILEDAFPHVDAIYPEANVHYVCTH